MYLHKTIVTIIEDDKIVQTSRWTHNIKWHFITIDIALNDL